MEDRACSAEVHPDQSRSPPAEIERSAPRFVEREHLSAGRRVLGIIPDHTRSAPDRPDVPDALRAARTSGRALDFLIALGHPSPDDGGGDRPAAGARPGRARARVSARPGSSTITGTTRRSSDAIGTIAA